MNAHPFIFSLPDKLLATAPPERRGIRRDYVKLLVWDRGKKDAEHDIFYRLDRYVKAGDLLVLNSSRTVPAMLKAVWVKNGRPVGTETEVRLARRLNGNEWEAFVVASGVECGDRLIFAPELQADIVGSSVNGPLLKLAFSLSGTRLFDALYQYGQPIRYEYIDTPWALDYYQTVFAAVPGSVEMPSAGRAFSWELLLKLRRQGVQIAYVQHHTGLSYLADEWTSEPADNAERFIVPEETAEFVRRAKQTGGRVIAVGTTVVRSLESAVGPDGSVHATEGWTRLYIDEHYPLRAVDGLLTGFHEPEASHLHMLAAFVNPDELQSLYANAIQSDYLWHEFGDMNLII